MKLKTLFFITLIVCSCAENENKKARQVEKTLATSVQTKTVIGDTVALQVYDYSGFEKYLTKKDDKIHVINFWATWCGPCVKELPYFEKLNAQYKSKQVDVLLVSLDFPHLYDTKLKPFIKHKNLKSKVIALDDADMNSWIPKVNASWTGAIPATVIYRNDRMEFYEQSFTYSELEQAVNKFIK